MKRTGIFLGITFLLTFAIEFAMMANGGAQNPAYHSILSSIMLIPSIAVLLTRAITKEGFENHYVKPRFRGNILGYILAYFTPQVLVFAGVCLYFYLFSNQLDLNMTQFGTALAEQAKAVQPDLEVTQEVVQNAAFSQVVMGIFAAPILNILYSFGEEWGWRGYLLPKLCERMSVRPAILLSGVIWGLWHAPLIAMGHNYGLSYPGFPWTGILAMTVFCVLFGAFLSYLTLRTKSVIPAALAHGGLNGFAALGTIFLKGTSNPFLGPGPMGLIGGFGVIVVGIVSIFVADKYSFSEEKPGKGKKNRKKVEAV